MIYSVRTSKAFLWLGLPRETTVVNLQVGRGEQNQISWGLITGTLGENCEYQGVA